MNSNYFVQISLEDKRKRGSAPSPIPINSRNITIYGLMEDDYKQLYGSYGDINIFDDDFILSSSINQINLNITPYSLNSVVPSAGIVFPIINNQLELEYISEELNNDSYYSLNIYNESASNVVDKIGSQIINEVPSNIDKIVLVIYDDRSSIYPSGDLPDFIDYSGQGKWIISKGSYRMSYDGRTGTVPDDPAGAKSQDIPNAITSVDSERKNGATYYLNNKIYWKAFWTHTDYEGNDSDDYSEWHSVNTTSGEESGEGQFYGFELDVDNDQPRLRLSCRVPINFWLTIMHTDGPWIEVPSNPSIGYTFRATFSSVIEQYYCDGIECRKYSC